MPTAPRNRAPRARAPQDPWFAVELPPNALSMNDKYLALPPACEQSEKEISVVIAAVRNSTV